ncbi:hypothetical protein AQUCO_00200926v1 [Aquilegia coerulea]|uniref:Endonuclease/exonuclease/phosphatase domain-containing protein n=1 Tax=Aquilegia coerulea TaxID=218851 RepID=A0A2G5F5L8_AQUCA|nr:hypothetical protein AQUCO_00200926v1 [Aquilegia coerulea]
MGAAESKPEVGTSNSNQDRYDREGRKNKKKSPSAGTTALAVGAAVGTVLLGVAWGVSRYRSKDSDEGVDDRMHYHHAAESDMGNYFKTLREYEISERMKAIGDLVQLHSPHFICFQEFTPTIFNIFRGSSWWSDYYCSMSTEEASNRQYFCILLSKFPPVKTITAPLGMGRELCVTETKIGTNKSLVVATSHLKSRFPNPNDPDSLYHQYTKQRLLQAKEALAILENYPNVIFGGDMNWDEKKDGEFPLLEGWVDAWTELRGEEVGHTFDTGSNKMLKGRPLVQMRFDRILCNLKDFELDDIEIIGKEAIPDASYKWNKKKLPVLPSDHYGLLLTICN